jgi:hypothetical protein
LEQEAEIWLLRKLVEQIALGGAVIPSGKTLWNYSVGVMQVSHTILHGHGGATISKPPRNVKTTV